MTSDDFLSANRGKGLRSWEAKAVELAEQGELTPWPWAELRLEDGEGHTATLQVLSDVVSVGPIGNHLRLPLTAEAAQKIADLYGAVLPTPWLVYQIWRSAPVKLEPRPMRPNKGANLAQFAEHSRIIDEQMRNEGAPEGALVAGQKKSLVVSNTMAPKREVIFGWYRPPPAPDVFDDGRPINAPNRQPIQPNSGRAHGQSYVDYSHGIRLVSNQALVDGRPMPTEELYQHPTLSSLVSHEGPIRTPRYGKARRAPPSPLAIATVKASPPTAALGAGLGVLTMGTALGVLAWVYREEIARFVRRFA